MISLWGALASTGHDTDRLIQMSVALLAVRLFHSLYHRPTPVLGSSLTNRKTGTLVLDESLISIFFVAACYIMQWSISRLDMAVYFLGNLALQMSLLYSSHLVLKYLSKRSTNFSKPGCNRQVMIVGTGKRAREVADHIIDSPEIETLLIGFLDYRKEMLWRYRDVPLVGHPEDFEKIVAVCHLDTLIVAVDPQDLGRTESLFRTAEKMGVPICLMPDIYQPRLARPKAAYLNGFPAIVYSAVPEEPSLMLLKSFIDRIGAAIGLILSAPLLLVTAVAIKLDSKGPVFFRQERSGLNGKPFRLLKFRTMVVDAESKKDQLRTLNEMSGPVFKIKNDPRVTRVGKMLRKFSIDEIPQFINVLNGEMSLVGPRPPLPKEVAGYEPWQRRKLSVKPGVTCIWQVGGRNNLDFDEWMRLDLEYIDNWSLWLDTKILARTIPVVMKGDGAS